MAKRAKARNQPDTASGLFLIIVLVMIILGVVAAVIYYVANQPFPSPH